MKNKTKVILGLSAIIGVTLGAGVTATYAWFISNRTATVNLTSATVYTDASNLAVEYVAVTNGGIIGSSFAQNEQILNINGQSVSITDISGDGQTFYKPSWAPDKENDTADSIPSVANGTTTYYVQFGLKLINTGNTDFSVYLDQGSSVTGASDSNPAQAAKNAQAAQATRVSVYHGSDCASLWQYDTTDSSFSYLKSQAGGDAYNSAADVALADPTTDFPGVWHLGAFAYKSSSADEDDGSLIAGVSKNSNAIVVVTVWIEGTLSVATNEAIGGKSNVTLRLAAI